MNKYSTIYYDENKQPIEIDNSSAKSMKQRAIRGFGVRNYEGISVVRDSPFYYKKLPNWEVIKIPLCLKGKCMIERRKHEISNTENSKPVITQGLGIYIVLFVVS